MYAEKYFTLIWRLGYFCDEKKAVQLFENEWKGMQFQNGNAKNRFSSIYMDKFVKAIKNFQFQVANTQGKSIKNISTTLPCGLTLFSTPRGRHALPSTVTRSKASLDGVQRTSPSQTEPIQPAGFSLSYDENLKCISLINV